MRFSYVCEKTNVKILQSFQLTAIDKLVIGIQTPPKSSPIYCIEGGLICYLLHYTMTTPSIEALPQATHAINNIYKLISFLSYSVNKPTAVIAGFIQAL